MGNRTVLEKNASVFCKKAPSGGHCQLKQKQQPKKNFSSNFGFQDFLSALQKIFSDR